MMGEELWFRRKVGFMQKSLDLGRIRQDSRNPGISGPGAARSGETGTFGGPRGSRNPESG